MSRYGMSTTLDAAFDEAVGRVREALQQQGFGVLTEIDVQATMRAKLGVEVPAQLILGACNPPLAHRALTAEPSIGLLLPCNVVVREEGEHTVVEAIDPLVLVQVSDNPELVQVAKEADARLSAALQSLRGAA